MKRMTWTDERLEERFDSIDRRFDKVDRRFEQVDRRFEQVDKQFDEVNRRIDGVDKQLGELRQGVVALQTTLNRGSIGVILGLIGVVGAILAHGG
jgi:DNA anti-recombination protein RmuC